ncbi:hypothetical protein G6F48_003155 [Rhizopus delemar]|nr:hypothetical protein G6F48_003155 [Rhizopus delemar]KAG1643385.1 hypothetical protein G6F44_003878 [Rhizopus delemar]
MYNSASPPLFTTNNSADDTKKRTRVTPGQLAILEETFSMTATPDSKLRKQLAERLKMPERSIQIWFQNRRAKVKMLQKRVLLRQEQEEANRTRLSPYWYPRQKMVHRAWSSDMIQPSSLPLPPPPPPLLSTTTTSSMFSSFNPDPPSISITGPTSYISPSPQPSLFKGLVESDDLNIGFITATSLTIGSWHRMKINQQDLECCYVIMDRQFSWHIRDNEYHFKMTVSFDAISTIEFIVLEDNISAQINLQLLEPPVFFMENNNSWIQCSDFTEGMQASLVLNHIIRGLAIDLRQQLLGIAGIDDRLCQITRFPLENDYLEQSTWRHSSIIYAKDYQLSFKKGILLIQLGQVHLSLKKTDKNVNHSAIIHTFLLYLSTLLLKYLVIQIKSFSIHHSNLFAFTDNLLLQKDNGQPIIQLQTGSIQLFQSQEQVLGLSSFFITYHEHQSKLSFSLGDLDLYLNNPIQSSYSFHQQKHEMAQENPFVRLMSVTVQSIHLYYHHPSSLSIHTTIHRLNATLTPLPLMAQFSTQTIELDLVSTDRATSRLFHLQQMEFQCALDQSFKNINVIMDSPKLSLDSKDLIHHLISTSSSNMPTSQKNKRLLPVFTLALIFRSPKIMGPALGDRALYVIARDFIVRLSGEYPAESSSQLDAHFAQEEYQWLNRQDTKRTSSKRWVNLVQKLSGSGPKGSYRAKSKVIFQKLSIGWDHQPSHKPSVTIKKATINTSTELTVDDQGQTALEFTNTVYADASIERPVIYLWDDQEPSSSLFLSAEREQQRPSWMTSLLRHLAFSLDLSSISISTFSLDPASRLPPPPHHIDNTPTEPIGVQLAFHVRRSTLVFEKQKVRCHLGTLSIEHLSSALSAQTPDPQLILWISQLDLSTSLWDKQKSPSVLVQVKKYGICYSITNHYVCLLVARSMSRFLEKTVGNQRSSSPVFPVIQLEVDRGDVRWELPGDTCLYLRLDRLSFQRTLAEWNVQFRNWMVLVRSTAEPDRWSQIIELDQCHISRHLSVIRWVTKKVFFSIPYRLILAHVIRGFVHHLKAVKDLQTRIFSQEAQYTFLGPSVRDEPVMVKAVEITAELFSFHLDDDPFEARLRTIFKTGLVEQQKRLAYQAAFDQKREACVESEQARAALAPEEQNRSGPVDEKRENPVKEAEQGLLSHFSKLWIKYIRKAIHTEQSFFESLYVAHDYRHPLNSSALDKDHGTPEDTALASLFHIQILPRPLHPPLANFSAESAQVELKPARIQDVRDFVHHIGSGVPRHSQFSFLIPFHLFIQAGRTWIKLRDYPVPLLYVPQDASSVSWTLEGDYVLTDELGDSRGSRLIHVPILPSYTLTAVRTVSPLKFYSILSYHVLTSGLSTVGWSIACKPAVQDVLRVLDTLIPPPVDLSLPLGWWDKFRFLYHSRIKIEFASDLGFSVKGTRDPYAVEGHGAGMAKIWSKEVVWFVGHANPQREFMQIVSQDYSFGVPDLVSAFVPDLPDGLPFEVKRGHRRFLKVVLKLSGGIRMGIGMHFERYGCDQQVCTKCGSHPIESCRSQSFSPHYQVSTYDSYKGYRSDFVHVSFSITQLEQQTVTPSVPDDEQHYGSRQPHNAMYLSQCFIDHFAAWYQLFGGPLSLPIRQGTLWPTEEKRAKAFGDHLDTLKYKVLLDSLSVGFFCSEEGSCLKNGRGSVGLKAHVRDFSIDLHSRREIVENQGFIKVERSFHEVKLQMSDADLRVIKASGEKGRTGRMKTSMDSSSHNRHSFADSTYSAYESMYNCRWVDPGDYILLEPLSTGNKQPEYTNTEVHPFLFSPLIYFVKQNDQEGDYLYRRASDLDKLIEELDQQLDNIIHALEICNYNGYHELKKQHQLISSKIDYLRKKRYMLHSYMGQIILETELNTEHEPRGSSQTSASSIFHAQSLDQWETLMGHFKGRCIIHNPQIIWNNSVRDIVFYWNELKTTRSLQSYNLSARCLQFLSNLAQTVKDQKEQQSFEDFEASKAQSMDEMIQRLLFEHETSFMAQSESEKDPKSDKINTENGIHPLENIHDNLDYQYKTIPEDYEMKSKILVDLIYPQLVFQSDRALDHLVLLTNERMQIKSIDIFDRSEPYAESTLVKNRNIISLDHAQLFVVSKFYAQEERDLIQHIYGHSGSKRHWAAWLQPEQLWYYREAKYFENFQRIISRLSGTIQLDLHNPLRIKTNKNSSSRQSTSEDRSTALQLHFPQLKLVTNSMQIHVLYYTITHLILDGNLSAGKRKRSDHFKETMLAAERSDLAESVKQVGMLQTNSRFLIYMHKQFLNQLSSLDSVGIAQFKANKKKMYECLERLYLVIEAIKSVQTLKQGSRMNEMNASVKLNFISNEMVWEALTTADQKEMSLCKWSLSRIKYDFTYNSNGSCRNAIEIEDVKVINTTESPIFINVLEAYHESGHPVKKMLHGVLDTLPPVGGIPVIQQLEINVAPLHLQISIAFGTALKDFFFPMIITNTPAENTDDQSNNDYEVKDTADSEDEDYDDVVSLVPILGGNNMKDKPKRLKLKRDSSFASIETLAKIMKGTFHGKSKPKQDELTIMKTRSSTNRTFIYIKISGAKHCISLRGPSKNTFYNIYDFPFHQPSLEYRNKTWSIAKMTEEVQKQFLRAILRHSPALIKRKVLPNKRQPIENSENQQIEVTNLMDDTFIGVCDADEGSSQASTDRQSSKSLSPYVSNEDDELQDAKSLYSDPGDSSDELESKRFSSKLDDTKISHQDRVILKGQVLLEEKTIIVDGATIQEVITSMKTSAIMASALTPFQRAEEDINESLENMAIRDGSFISESSNFISSQAIEETIDVAQHFHVVNAFDIPKLEYDDFTRTFRKSKSSCNLLSQPREKTEMIRERYVLAKQRLLRNETFRPAEMSISDSAYFTKITPIKSLIGQDGKDFVLFGMLTQITDGKLYLEDDDAYIELDVSQSKYGYGLFTDGAFAIVEGTFGEDHIFHVSEINLPPAEARDMTDAILNNIDFFGLPKPLVDENLLKKEERIHEDIFFVIISDVRLDQPKVLDGLRTMFNEYNNQVPLAIIFIGSFTSKPFTASSEDVVEYKDKFNALADLISEYDELATHTNFVFVPGAGDPWGGQILPQSPLPLSFVTRIKQKVKKAHFTTNPCRIRYCTQDIVIFREDLLNKILSDTLLPINLSVDSHRVKHLIQTILDQGHLYPLSKKPIYWDYDHALRLFPLPHALIIADKCENYGITYEGTHCVNPGSFSNSDMSWSIYYPSSQTSTKCSLSGH